MADSVTGREAGVVLHEGLDGTMTDRESDAGRQAGGDLHEGLKDSMTDRE